MTAEVVGVSGGGVVCRALSNLVGEGGEDKREATGSVETRCTRVLLSMLGLTVFVVVVVGADQLDISKRKARRQVREILHAPLARRLTGKFAMRSMQSSRQA
jgi:methyl coenzyme M reductase subunit C-like uncharacterized protein (methanogenesis marker protein 7)